MNRRETIGVETMKKPFSLDLSSPTLAASSSRGIKQELYKVVEMTEDFQKIYKPYRKVNGYADFKKVALELASVPLFAKEVGIHQFDKTQQEVVFCAKLAADKGCPVYWLDQNLAHSFLQTDIPKDISFLKPAIEHFILMLPPLIHTPDREPLNFVFVHYIKAGEVLEFKVGKDNLCHVNGSANRMRWATVLGSGICYSITTEIGEGDKSGLVQGDFVVGDNATAFLGGVNTDTSTEELFVSTVVKIVVNSLMFLQCFKDKALTEEKSHNLQMSQGIGFAAKIKKDTVPLLSPIWVGKDYKPPTRKANSGDEELSRTYAIHTKSFWRRGHYRHVPIGKKEEGGRKLTWIEPVFITR